MVVVVFDIFEVIILIVVVVEVLDLICFCSIISHLPNRSQPADFINLCSDLDEIGHGYHRGTCSI